MSNDLKCWLLRAQANDRSLEEMEPAETFTLKLRGYQKQALRYASPLQHSLESESKLMPIRWMHSLETGEVSARKAKSMHPLWDA